MFPHYRFRPLVATACLAAMLSGCGGGSSDTMPDADGPDMPMTGGETSGPVAFMAGVDRLYSSNRTEEISDDSMTMVTEDTTQSPSGWNLTVDGKSASLAGSDHGTNQLNPHAYVKDLGNNEEVWFWSEEGGGFEGDPDAEFDYLNVYGFSHGNRVPDADLSTIEPADYERGDYIYIVHGTPTNDMPVSGGASYDGKVRAREWSSDAATFSGGSTRYRGDFSMTATFEATGAAITGAFSNLEQRAPGAGSYTSIPGGIIPFTTSVTGNQLSISGVSIDEGPFAGYGDIGIRGAFFGPAADEVGGVFEGENTAAATLLHGWFAGEKQ